MISNKSYASIVSHYEDRLDKYGDSHLGVDWPNQADALTRYQVMLDVIRETNSSKNHAPRLWVWCITPI